MAPSQRVDKPESGIVPGARVLAARIAEPDDQLEGQG
jgi:hypothetical protein